MTSKKVVKEEVEELDIDINELGNLDSTQKNRINRFSSYYSIANETVQDQPFLPSSYSFKIDLYLKKNFAKKKQGELVKEYKKNAKEIGRLDQSLQKHVYQNYSKFIESSGIIKRMKSDVEEVSEKMTVLNDTFLEVLNQTKNINDHLTPTMMNIRKNHAISTMLRKMHFLLELPKRLQQSLDKKYFSLCLRYYNVGKGVLQKYPDLFKSIDLQVKEVMNKLKIELQEIVFQEPETDSDLYSKKKENILLLVELGEDRGSIRDRFLGMAYKYISQKIHQELKKSLSRKEGETYTPKKLEVSALSLYRMFRFHVENLYDIFAHCFLKSSRSSLQNHMKDFYVEYFGKLRLLVSSQYLGMFKGKNRIPSIFDPRYKNLTEKLYNTFKSLFYHIRTFKELHQECLQKTKRSNLIEQDFDVFVRFLDNEFEKFFRFILRERILEQSYDLTQLYFEEYLRRASQFQKNEFDTSPKASPFFSQVEEESKKISNDFVQAVDIVTTNYKTFLSVTVDHSAGKRRKKGRGSGGESGFSSVRRLTKYYSWALEKVNELMAWVLEFITSKLCKTYAEVGIYDGNDEPKYLTKRIGCYVLYLFAQKTSINSIPTIHRTLTHRFQDPLTRRSKKKVNSSSTKQQEQEVRLVFFDPQDMSYQMSQKAVQVLNYLVELEGRNFQRLVRAGLELLPRTVGTGPTKVSYMLKHCANEVNELSNELRMMFTHQKKQDFLHQQQHEEDDTDLLSQFEKMSSYSDRDSSDRSLSSYRYYQNASSLRYGQTTDSSSGGGRGSGGKGGDDLKSLMLDHEQLLREQGKLLYRKVFEIFSAEVRETGPRSLVFQTIKILLKAYDEALRGEKFITSFAFQQIQVDVYFLMEMVKKLVGKRRRDVLVKLLNEVLKSAVERCSEPKTMKSIIVQNLVKDQMKRRKR